MRFFIFFIWITLPVYSLAEELEGLWVWEKNSDSHTFSIRIENGDNGLTGYYCAVGASGRRIDCSPKKHAHTFPIDLDGSEFEFTTSYSSKTGTAALTMVGDKLYWVIKSQPKGEHYAPKSATLFKYQSHNK
ncbi:hypothetical protein [Bacterioplanoides pacificum]|uniref:Lipocalin-like domain-containing protein n=1 Tax=Bacterioplanoides pacificum TaxID=1171596 RepID=A0ABV7VUA8_9GAMM